MPLDVTPGRVLSICLRSLLLDLLLLFHVPFLQGSLPVCSFIPVVTICLSLACLKECFQPSFTFSLDIQAFLSLSLLSFKGIQRLVHMVRKLLRNMIQFPESGPPEFPAGFQRCKGLREEENTRRTS